MEKEEQNVQEEMEEDKQKEDLSTMADRLRIRSGKKPSYVDFGEEEVYAEVEQAENTDNKQQSRKKKPREDLCSVCKSGEKLIPCATCPAAYHLGCIVPPLKVVPRRKWSCAQCADPLNEIDKFLDCQFRPLINISGSKGEDDAETGSLPESQVKQYLVKWKSRSYLHPSWIPEADLETAAKANPGLKMKLNHFRKLFDSPKGWNTLEDDWIAIRPEWTTVEKVLDFRQTGALKEYLVKWKELGYEDITWEIEEDISAFQAQIDRFNARRNRHPTNTSKKRKGSTLDGRETKKKRKEFKAVEETPKFLVGGILHPYQLEGLNFLRFAWHQQKHVILADEMGLGKTIQSIAFLASLMEEGISLPHLVVAPLSTLRNWEREFATWAPHMNTVMYAGSAPARAVIRAYEFYFPKEKEPKKKRKNSKKKQASGQKLKDNKQDRIKFDVLLTSYEMINIDTAILKSLKWGCLIVDEGHRLKNKDSKLFQTMRQYSTMHRVLLTGTPLQNNLDELFMLMHFLDAGKFASLDDFQQEFKDINQEEQIARLHKMLAPHLLRRVKKDVLKDLPPKKELILRVELSPLQKDYYKAILTKNYELLSRRSGPQISLNNVVMELRKLCGHPYLLPGVEEELRRSQDLHRQLVEASGKLLLMDKMMVKLKALGHRVLIYCQFKLMLDILEDWLSVKKWGYERIDGQISGSERQIRIDRFNAPNSTRFCFLLSTRAGGLGINLASADTVIIYDSDWNPHADLQAMARAHRLGQTNKVMIYRLVTRGSIEERMMQLTKKKMVLEHLVVGRLKTKQVLNQEELDDILRYGAAELFAEEGDETKKSQQIHYDDAAIDRLLDRSQIENDDVAADVEDNDFLKAFKVANFEYIDEEATAPDKVVLDVMADRDAESSSNYWDTLLKQRFEEKKYESLTELGKGKRARKQVVHATEDDLAGMTNVTSDEEDDVPVIAETNVGVKESSDVSGKKPPVSKKKPRGPAPLMEGEGKSLSILGFSRRQRAIFVQILMRFGLGDFSWNEFIPRLKPKTADEIREYGTAFLTHIAEDITDSPTFSDGVPKEGLRIQDVLVRLAILHLIQDKVKFVTEEPTSPVFSDDVHRRLPALTNTKTWKEPHDVGLLQAILKYGYGCWQEILDDEGLDFQSVICKELQLALPVGAAQSSKEKMQMLSASSREDNSALLTEKTTAVDLSQTDEEKMLPRVIDEKLPQAQSVQMADRGIPKDNQENQLVHKRMVEFLKKRTVLLEKALNAEYHQETAADQKGEDTYEDDNAMDMRGSESANNIETQSMQSHMQTQSQVPSQLQTQQSHSQCPNLVPLVPNEVVAHAYDNEPSRLEIGRIYNEICRLINESETDAEETYSGNKSAGVRLRKISRQIDVLCFRMRKMLVATNHYGSTPDRGIGQLSQNNGGLFTGIDVDAHSYQHEDDVEADMDSDPEMPSMPSTALENQRGQAFEQREMCSDKVSSFYLPHVDSVSNRFPSAIWKQDSGSGMYSTPQTNVSSWPSPVVIVDD